MHNHYLTLPVLFMMLSNHFPSTYGSKHAWLVLTLLVVFGVALKIVMIQRTDSKPLVLLALLGSLIGVVILTKPANHHVELSGTPVPFARAQEVVLTRCVPCHASHPTHPAFSVAPKGLMLDSPTLMTQHAAQIYVQAVETKVMPLGNLTNITEEERATLGAWVKSRARRSSKRRRIEMGISTHILDTARPPRRRCRGHARSPRRRVLCPRRDGNDESRRPRPGSLARRRRAAAWPVSPAVSGRRLLCGPQRRGVLSLGHHRIFRQERGRTLPRSAAPAAVWVLDLSRLLIRVRPHPSPHEVPMHIRSLPSLPLVTLLATALPRSTSAAAATPEVAATRRRMRPRATTARPPASALPLLSGIHRRRHRAGAYKDSCTSVPGAVWASAGCPA